jgi:hypothetical protein
VGRILRRGSTVCGYGGWQLCCSGRYFSSVKESYWEKSSHYEENYQTPSYLVEENLASQWISKSKVPRTFASLTL